VRGHTTGVVEQALAMTQESHHGDVQILYSSLPSSRTGPITSSSSRSDLDGKRLPQLASGTPRLSASPPNGGLPGPGDSEEQVIVDARCVEKGKRAVRPPPDSVPHARYASQIEPIFTELHAKEQARQEEQRQADAAQRESIRRAKNRVLVYAWPEVREARLCVEFSRSNMAFRIIQSRSLANFKKGLHCPISNYTWHCG
jgi:hypothetical protein